jgi:carbon monoxide dehydrogenase subunit G
MAHLVIRRRINARPEAVWDVIADLERQGEWMVDVRQLRITTPQKQGVGTVLRVTSELFGLPVVRDVMAITRWEPPRRMDGEHRGMFHGTGSFVLDTDGAGGTAFAWTEDFQPPLGWLGELAFAAVVRPHLMRVFARSVANVARLAESAERRPPA